MAERSVSVGPFTPGVNNRLRPTELDTVLPNRTKARYLAGASNVDLDDDGRLKRRAGVASSLSANIHSLWSAPPAYVGYAVIDGNLERLSPSGASYARTVIRSGVGPAPVSYSLGADGDVYWTNGVMLRRITPAGADRAVLTPAPATPAVTFGAGGLPAGRYLLTFTVVDEDGESPSSEILQFDLPENSSVAYAAAQSVQAFLSAPNGDILQWQVEGASNTIYTFSYDGRRCMTKNADVMPAGQIVRHYRGSLLVAAGNVLCVSEPYNYGLFSSSRGYFQLPAPITVLEPTDDVLYIVADKTYAVGDPFNDQLEEMLPYGAVPRTSGHALNGTQVYWFSERGLVLADKNKSVKNVQEDALRFAVAGSGASLYREADGMTHILTSRRQVAMGATTANFWFDAEVIRKGTIV